MTCSEILSAPPLSTSPALPCSLAPSMPDRNTTRLRQCYCTTHECCGALVLAHVTASHTWSDLLWWHSCSCVLQGTGLCQQLLKTLVQSHKLSHTLYVHLHHHFLLMSCSQIHHAFQLALLNKKCLTMVLWQVRTSTFWPLAVHYQT